MMTSMFTFSLAAAAIAAGSLAQGPKPDMKRYELPKLRMSAVLPFPPGISKVAPDTGKDIIKAAYWYVSNWSDLSIMLNFTEYKPGNKVDLAEAARGIHHVIRTRMSAKIVSSASKATQYRGLPAYRLHYVVEQDGMTRVYRSLIFAKGLRLWQMSATYEAGSETSALATRSFESLRVRL